MTDYVKTVWRDNQSPAINAENLNHIEDGIFNATKSVNTVADNTQELATNLGNVKSQVNQIDQRLKELKTSTSKLSTEVTSVSDSLRGVNNKLDTVKSDNESQQSKIELNGINIKANKDEINRVSKQSADNGKKISVLVDAIKSDETNLSFYENAKGTSIAIADSVNQELKGLKLYGKSEKNGNPTIANTTVRVSGRNLFTLSDWNIFNENSDGSYELGNTEQVHLFGFELCGNITLSYMGKCKLPNELSNFRIELLFKDGTTPYVSGLSSTNWELKKFNINASKENPVVGLRSTWGYPGYNYIKDFYIGIGDESSYTPYIPPQTLTVPFTLNGIPVSRGGNYTDESGQDWIADYVDFERGVLVRHLATGGTILGKPTTSSLTETDFQEFRRLHTLYQYTTILNNKGAYMNVEYAVDTKKYIDNKFEELAKAIVFEKGSL